MVPCFLSALCLSDPHFGDRRRQFKSAVQARQLFRSTGRSMGRRNRFTPRVPLVRLTLAPRFRESAALPFAPPTSSPDVPPNLFAARLLSRWPGPSINRVGRRTIRVTAIHAKVILFVT